MSDFGAFLHRENNIQGSLETNGIILIHKPLSSTHTFTKMSFSVSSASSSSCTANAPPSFGVGGACTSHGACVPAAPGLTQVATCVCDEWYDGGNDFFDSRTSIGSVNLQCSNFRQGVIAIWSLILVLIFVRCVKLTKTLISYREKYRKNGSPSQKLKPFYADVIYRDLLIDLFVTPSCCVTLVALKIRGHVLGSDVGVTVLFSLTVMLFNLVTNDTSREEFRIILRASVFNPTAVTRLQRTREKLQILSFSVYVGVVVVPSLWALSTDKTKGPLDNNEFVVIPVRNIGAVLWSIIEVISIRLLRSQVQSLLSSDVSAASATSNVIRRLDDETRSLYTVFGFILVVYPAFCIPYLWPFQTYQIALIVLIGVSRHTGQHLKHLTAPSNGGSLQIQNTGNNLAPSATSSNKEPTSGKTV